MNRQNKILILKERIKDERGNYLYCKRWGKFTSKEECLEHDRQLEKRDAANKEKNQTLDSIREKYDSLIDDVEKYQVRYNEPVSFIGKNPRYVTMPDILRELFNMV